MLEVLQYLGRVTPTKEYIGRTGLYRFVLSSHIVKYTYLQKGPSLKNLQTVRGECVSCSSIGHSNN